MSALERRITVTAVVLPLLGFVTALYLCWGGAVSGLDVAILAAMYVLAGLGVTVGFHRLLTHRSFVAVPWLRVTLAVLGSMAVQGAVIHWVADHRKHHTFADEDGDPHSPHTGDGTGWRRVARGIWHAHLGWMLSREHRASARRFAPDLRTDRHIVLVDRLFPALALAGLAVPFVAGFALSGGVLRAGLTAALWGGLVRVFLFHHATWSVNSICHLYGRRPFATGDESRNNWAVALLTFGEGWHHNHHAFPTSARHGLAPAQLDLSYAVICCFERLGWATDVRRMPSATIERAARGRSLISEAPGRRGAATSAGSATSPPRGSRRAACAGCS
jgi:stearoyl-CoA desaturase (Delta-9 desaturase)